MRKNNKKRDHMTNYGENPLNYRAGLRDCNDITLKGTTYATLIKALKKLGNIDCRKTHAKQFIASEFRPGSFGYFYWNKQTGSLDAWIEWN